MAYWPDVTRGEKVQHHMLLENNIRHMINSLDGFGSTPNRGSSNGVVRIPIWNSSNAAFSAGQPVSFDSSKALCGDAVPAVPVTDKKKPWGVCEKYIEPNGIGECIISGYARVSITGSNGDKAEPYGSGTSFIRGNSGVPIIWNSVSDGVGIIHLGGGGGSAEITGPFDVKIENGSVIVYDSSNLNSNSAGIVHSGTWRDWVPVTTFTAADGTVYLNILYTPNQGYTTVELKLGEYPQTIAERQYTERIAVITSSENGFSISRCRVVGDIHVLGRWV